MYVTSRVQDYRTAVQLLAPAGIRLHRAASLHQAHFLLAATGALVLLSDEAFLEGTWRDSNAMLAAHHPRAALVVVAGKADEGFWIDALEQGVYDLVLRPFRADELRRVLENAQAQARFAGRAIRHA